MQFKYLKKVPEIIMNLIVELKFTPATSHHVLAIKVYLSFVSLYHQVILLWKS